MPCHLHVEMPDGAGVLLEAISMKPYRFVKRGTSSRARPGVVYDSDVLSFDVSDADFQDLPQQFEEALTFLKKNENDVRVLAMSGEVVLDFGHTPRKWAQSVVQVDRVPQELIRVCAGLNVHIELSMYLWQDEEENPELDAV